VTWPKPVTKEHCQIEFSNLMTCTAALAGYSRSLNAYSALVTNGAPESVLVLIDATTNLWCEDSESNEKVQGFPTAYRQVKASIPFTGDGSTHANPKPTEISSTCESNAQDLRSIRISRDQFMMMRRGVSVAQALDRSRLTTIGKCELPSICSQSSFPSGHFAFSPSAVARTGGVHASWCGPGQKIFQSLDGPDVVSMPHLRPAAIQSWSGVRIEASADFVEDLQFRSPIRSPARAPTSAAVASAAPTVSACTARGPCSGDCHAAAAAKDKEEAEALESEPEVASEDEEPLQVLVGPSQLASAPWAINDLWLLQPPKEEGGAFEKVMISSSPDVLRLSDTKLLAAARPDGLPLSFGYIVHLRFGRRQPCRPCMFEKSKTRSCRRSWLCDFCHLHTRGASGAADGPPE